jgi:hypothetical protein
VRESILHQQRHDDGACQAKRDYYSKGFRRKPNEQQPFKIEVSRRRSKQHTEKGTFDHELTASVFSPNPREASQEQSQQDALRQIAETHQKIRDGQVSDELVKRLTRERADGSVDDQE